MKYIYVGKTGFVNFNGKSKYLLQGQSVASDKEIPSPFFVKVKEDNKPLLSDKPSKVTAMLSTEPTHKVNTNAKMETKDKVEDKALSKKKVEDK